MSGRGTGGDGSPHPGGPGPDPALLRRLEAAHYQIVGALYGCRGTPTDHGLWVRSDFVDDPEWNHLGRLEPGAVASSPDGVLAAATRLAAESGRRPTVAVSPLSRQPGLVDALEREGWEPSYRHVWLVDSDVPAHPAAAADTAGPDADPGTGGASGVEPETPSGVTIRPVSDRADLTAFLDVFSAVFVPDDPADAAAWRGALEASTRVTGGPVVVHHLAECDGAPAGIASAVYAGGVAGGFNLGVLPAFRGRGIGGALTLARRLSARRAGNDLVYLITEDPVVEASQIRRGHRRVMETRGWSA